MHPRFAMVVAAAMLAGWTAASARSREPSTAPAWVTSGRVPAGRTLLVVYNASGRTLFGGAYTVRVDGRKVARLARGEYSAVLLEPGLHDARVESFRKVPFATAPDRVVHWAVAYSPAAGWGAPLAGSGFGYGVVPDSLGLRLAAASSWVDPLVPLEEAASADSAAAP